MPTSGRQPDNLVLRQSENDGFGSYVGSNGVLRPPAVATCSGRCVSEPEAINFLPCADSCSCKRLESILTQLGEAVVSDHLE